MKCRATSAAIELSSVEGEGAKGQTVTKLSHCLSEQVKSSAKFCFVAIVVVVVVVVSPRS